MKFLGVMDLGSSGLRSQSLRLVIWESCVTVTKDVWRGLRQFRYSVDSVGRSHSPLSQASV